MKSKIKSLLFEYTKNARITTKELGKKIGASQQSAFYLLANLKKKKMIESLSTVVDPVKFGHLAVLVGINLIKTDPETKKEILDELKTIPAIVGIEECKEGIDFIIEYITPTLSAFSRTNAELINRFSKKMRVVFVYPVITVHEYNKNYLIQKFDFSDKILCEDNERVEITEQEEKILRELIKSPDEKLVDIAESTLIPIKSVITIKRDLEKRNIIKGYTAIINNAKLDIHRQIILLKFFGEGILEIDKFEDYAKNNRNIVKLFRLIGEYQIAIIVEDVDQTNIIKDIRVSFPIDNYRIMKSERIHKKFYLPLAEND
jgi:DNA-binding Lrp family transcriptional regulator